MNGYIDIIALEADEKTVTYSIQAYLAKNAEHPINREALVNELHKFTIALNEPDEISGKNRLMGFIAECLSRFEEEHLKNLKSK